MILESLSKDALWDRLMSREIRGKTVGKARAAFRLTIKSLWDYPEMIRREIVPTSPERERATAELNRIIRAIQKQSVQPSTRSSTR